MKMFLGNFILHVTKTISWNFDIIGRVRPILPKHIIIALYYTLVLPLLNYCKLVYYGTTNKPHYPPYIYFKKVVRIHTKSTTLRNINHY